MVNPPLLDVALPGDFDVFSATPEYASNKDKMDMTYGVIWADPETGKEYA